MVVVSEDQERVAAYNVTLGEWHILSLEGINLGAGKVTPVLDTNLVSLSLPDRVYAYSSISGKWADLKIPAGEMKTVVNQFQRISVTHGDILSMFSAQTGTWSSLNWKRGKKINWKDEKELR